MGADKSYATSDRETFEKLEAYFDLVINTLPVEIDLNQYLNLFALDRTTAVVGLPEKETSIGAASPFNARRSLAVLESKRPRERGAYRIQKVNEAYERVANSDVRYRFVIDVIDMKPLMSKD